MEARVSAILQRKGNSVVTISPQATVFEAIGRMVEHNVGSILVVDDEGAIAGIFTERDYLRRIALEGRTSRETKVHDVMTIGVHCIDPAFSVQDCMALMTELKCRHLPVVENGRLIGLISIGDCVKAVAEAHETRAGHLHRFVTGAYPA